jgi:hypothetical protein
MPEQRKIINKVVNHNSDLVLAVFAIQEMVYHAVSEL